LTTWHCILSAELTKTHETVFLAIFPTGYLVKVDLDES